MTDPTVDAERRATEVLAEHYFFTLDPGRCAGCLTRLPCDGEVMDEHRAHVAAMLAQAGVLADAQHDAEVAVVVEYGVRDWGGDVISDPDWRCVADVVAGVAAHGYRVAGDSGDIVTRTRTITTRVTPFVPVRARAERTGQT